MTAVDPVCGMPVDERFGVSLDRDSRRLWFCTEFCKQQFSRHPSSYAEEGPTGAPSAVDWAARRVAYFTMEIAFANEVPTYAGGLGVLAGDTVRSMADLEVPAVAVSLVHRKGYLRQALRDGRQLEQDASWQPERMVTRLKPVVTVEVEGRPVRIHAWQYDCMGSNGYPVPIVLLDSDTPENADDDRRITDHLYGGDAAYRLKQEIVLGMAGVRMLQALGCVGLRTFHLNEGHAALAPLELLREHSQQGEWDFQWIRKRMVFTTHTPVAAGHDQFDRALVNRALGDVVPNGVLDMLGGGDRLNMTHLALNLSHYVNGVALRHREISSQLFPGYEIHQITNGVHSQTWTGASFKALYDHRIPGWRDDPLMLRNATALPGDEVWRAHQRAKEELLEQVLGRTGRRLSPEVMTLGFARRATAYKRPELVLSDLARLRAISRSRPLQIVFAGKAHPKDQAGKDSIAAILLAASELGSDVPVVFLEDYDLRLALCLVAGTDLWLNTPQRPLEASGTSGMKAAHNGVPSFSVLDGWWNEGHIEGATGWSIGGVEPGGDDGADARGLYDKLEQRILPLFYHDRAAWIRVMQQSIAVNASFFNTHRMVRQYLQHAYAHDDEP